MNIQLKQFADWCGANYDGAARTVSGVTIDSRRVAPGDAFFAFKGERVNGEDYVDDALAKGASCAVVAADYRTDNPNVIVVADVLAALQRAARHYRQLFGLKVIAITGSVGKTSTKDILATILRQKFKVLATAGNYNNEIGLPLTIFELTPDHDVAVLEMGMNHYGELATLGTIANQDIAVITNIGTAHIEFFGSRQNIAAAKLEICQPLAAGDALILNGKDDILQRQESDQYDIYYSGRPSDDLYAENISIDLTGTQFDLVYRQVRQRASMPVYGEHFVDNALLAVRAALLLEVDMATIIAGLARVKLAKMRFQLQAIAGRSFINDAYNASVDSMIMSVATLCQLPFERRYAILGDIFECGQYAAEVHREIGQRLNDYPLDGILFVGADMAYAAECYRGNWRHCAKAAALAHMQYRAGDGILVKASRGMALETLIDDYRSTVDE